jgi:hypothetical protein
MCPRASGVTENIARHKILSLNRNNLMKKILISLSFILLIFLSKTAHSQQVVSPSNDIKQNYPYVIVPIKGRVIGINLEILQGVTITDKRTGDKTSSDNNGIYQLNVAEGDTITFELAPRSEETRVIKHTKDALNVILIKRTADQLQANSSPTDFKKAKKADDELYRILEKDAKLEGKWNY